MTRSSLKLLAAAAVITLAATAAAQMPGGAPANPKQAGFQRIGTPPPMDDFADNTGFTSLFDGTLKGWDYDKNLWDIKDGAIHIMASCEKPTGTVYAVSTAGEFGDFVLKYEMKGTGNINGGMQFRSYIPSETGHSGVTFPPQQRFTPPARPAGAAAAPRPPRPAACANPGTAPTKEQEAKWDMAGPQADFDAKDAYPGMFYEQSGRAVIATPGYSLYADATGSWAMAQIADKATLSSWFHKDDYNQFVVVALGHSTSIYMNGHLITHLDDTDPKYFRPTGKIGVESESTGDLWVKNISIKKIQ
jgi:hypothetical protein